MTAISRDDLAAEYERLATRAAGAPGPGRATSLGWDLEYTSADALMAFVDQILYRRMNDFLSDGDRPVILDCGANIGYTSLHCKRQYPGAAIIAFEPDPQFAPLLRRNLARNGAGDVVVVEAAAWTTDGRASWLMEGKDGSRLVTPSTAASVEVATVDLARYLDRDVDLLKVDIEGAEFTVVPHVASRLGRVKNILVECHLAAQSSYDDLARLLATLRAAGFRISLNSYGPWRDLTRRHEPAPLHAEQYMIVAGWRTESAGLSREQTHLPYAGLPYEMEWRRQGDLVRQVVGGLATSPDRWAVHRMTGRFRHEGGRCWTWPCPAGLAPGDSPEGADAPTVILEDERVLGPGHAMHEDIRTEGRGRFSHWNSAIYFSTSDGSDPTTNGRCYTAVLRHQHQGSGGNLTPMLTSPTPPVEHTRDANPPCLVTPDAASFPPQSA
jgi:FkbM family methyltransferase